VNNGPVETERLIAERYRLRHVLGRGSMGTVWAAHDEVLRRAVAVKEMLRPPGMADAETGELRERTLREARSVAQLSHPNLVTLYDVVQFEGEPYVVMELVPSSSLADLVRTRGPLTPEQGAAVANAVAAALEAAHRAGITHRDVKPGNVLIADDGRIKLTDFGIARNMAEATMTSRGITLGTPAFIPPEVASGGQVTSAADLWSLGATLFAAMTGHPPYEGANVLQTINQVVHGEVPAPLGTGALAPVISGLMTKDPSARMPLHEVRRLVRPIVAEHGPELFSQRTTTGETATVEVRPIGRPPLITPKPIIPPDTPLAPDPGPLPFRQADPTRPLRKSRKPAVTAVLVSTALLLFAAAGGAGFALTRFVAGADVLPPPQQTVFEVPAIEETLRLKTRVASAATANGAQGADFKIDVGEDWTSYVEQRLNGNLPSSMVVHLVDPNGVYEVAVQRFANFYPKSRIKDYQAQVRSRWAAGNQIFGEAQVGTADLAPNGVEPAIQFSYRTVERGMDLAKSPQGAGTDLRRSRYSRVLPYGADLWVVEVVFPTDQEDSGRNKLFNAISTTFAPLL
jgi:hypothetical protein